MLINIVIALSVLVSVSCSQEKNGKLSPAPDAISENRKNEMKASYKPEKLWETPREFKVAESIIYDTERNRIYISNIDGQPMDKDGKGFISIMATDGKITTLEWIKGLNAPKGMGINGNLLYVTDIDRIIEIDIDKSVINKTYNVKGAIFLNDIAISADGSVYISDMEANCIYLLKDGKAERWLDIARPNGMLFENNKLFAGSMAEKAVYEINTNDKSKNIVAKNNSGIDGLKQFREGMFIVSDWAGKTNLIGKDGVVIELLNTSNDKIQSADIEFIKDKNILLIPTFFDNRVVAYKIIEN